MDMVHKKGSHNIPSNSLQQGEYQDRDENGEAII